MSALRRGTSCRRWATTRMSPATWTTSTSIFVPAPTTRWGACGPRSMKTSLPPRSRWRIPAWASADRRARLRRCPAGGPINKEKTAMTNAALHRWLLISLLAIVATLIDREVSRAQTTEGTDLSIELVDPKVLRVCADPRNLPFSNEKGEGFENKLAELFAEKLQKKLDYMFFPQATGFVRMTLGAHRCDVIMGFPQGDEIVQGTNPYYRTAYALVAKPGSGLEDVTSLGDERLKGKRLGIVAGTPPATNMAANGLMTNARPYPLMIDTRIDSSAVAMIKDLMSGEIDAGVLWGPMAGYYARQANPPLHVTPLVKETSGPRLAYRIGMGVRPADRNWKRLLNRLIQENQPAINKILLDFGVPLLDENDRPISAEMTTKRP